MATICASTGHSSDVGGPPGNLPSTSGVIVIAGNGSSRWVHYPTALPTAPTRWMTRIDCEGLDGLVEMVAGFYSPSGNFLSDLGIFEVDARAVYEQTVPTPPPQSSEVLLGIFAQGDVGRRLKIYSYCTGPIGVSRPSPLRQSGRTDGLIGAPRQGPAALSSQIRQGRSLVR